MKDVLNRDFLTVRYIWESLPESAKERCYFFNSFFWKKLTEKSGVPSNPLTAGPRGAASAANHERVKKWTKVCVIH